MGRNKNWFKQVIADILVTLTIVITVLTDYRWLEYVVITYTYLMLAIKILVSLNAQLQAIVKKNQSTVPILFYHLMYATNIVVLASFGWLLTAAAWVLIWGLSEYHRRNI